MKIVVIGGSGLIGSASAVGRIATDSPVNGTVEVGGPEQFRLDELIRQGLACAWSPHPLRPERPDTGGSGAIFQQSGYIRAKLAQEKLIKESSIPYSLVHATQFFEFGKRIADDATDGNSVHVPPVLFQPIAADAGGHLFQRVSATLLRKRLIYFEEG